MVDSVRISPQSLQEKDPHSKSTQSENGEEIPVCPICWRKCMGVGRCSLFSISPTLEEIIDLVIVCLPIDSINIHTLAIDTDLDLVKANSSRII